jgi:hypothetical protein
MRSPAGLLLLLGAVLATAARASAEDAPAPLHVEAQEQHSGIGSGARVSVTIAPDGAVRAVWESPRSEEKPEVVEFRLPDGEMARAREAVIASRFFESRSHGPAPLDGSTWTVRVRLGGQELSRSDIGTVPEFEPLRRYLEPLSNQASVTAGLRRGDFRAAASLAYGPTPRVAFLRGVVDELAACAAKQDTPTKSAEAAELLLRLAEPGDWPRVAKVVLARLDGDRRGAVLAAWADVMKRPENAAHRSAFAPIFLAEADASAPRWASLTPQEKVGFEAVIGRLLLDGEARAFEISERMARANGTPDKPFLTPWLVETGEAAVPLVVRLMDAPEPQARANAVEIAHAQIGVLRKRFGLRERLSDAARAVLDARVGDEVVPALERRLRDPSESYALRTTCVTLLDWWDGRCKAARARALEREAESQRRDRATEVAASLPPPPAGRLALAGRLLGPFDVPLPGFTVLAVQPDGRPAAHAITGSDGAFRIEGLAEGRYDLVETAPGHLPPFLPKAARAAEGVDAGQDGVVVRIPGSMIRGRVVDAAGAPLARLPLLAQPRDAPSEPAAMWSHQVDTDDAGTFWIMRLPAGAYDLAARDAAGSGLRGGVGLEAGPEARMVQAQAGAPIAGLLLDETGAPVVDATVQLFDPGPAWFSYRSARSSADGSFRLERVDPFRGHRLSVVVAGSDGAARGAGGADVRGGRAGLLLRLGAAPRLRFQVAVPNDRQCERDVRIVRIAGGPPLWHRFSSTPVDWSGAPSGTWRVFVRARDLDAEGVPQCVWLEVGTATTGEPEKALSAPR